MNMRTASPIAWAVLAALAATAAMPRPAWGQETPVPHVNAFTPHAGEPGTIVKIAGTDLDQVLSIEFAGGATSDFTLFTRTMLKVPVPEGAQTGVITLRGVRGTAATPAEFRVILPPPDPARLFRPRPLPGRGPFTLHFQLPATSRADLHVLDLHGRVVRTLRTGVLNAGPHVTMWDARDSGGRRVSPGMYFVRLTLHEHHRLTQRLVVLE